MSHYSKSWDGKAKSYSNTLSLLVPPSKYVNTSPVPICRQHDWKAKDVQGGRLLEKCTRCLQLKFTPYPSSGLD